MTVTKQQQLEWLANKHEKWPASGSSVVMSGHGIGWFGWCYYITQEEWQQERDKMQKQPAKPAQDSSWHERGDFPPAGCECEVKYRGEWIKTVIIGMSPYNSCVFSLADHSDGPAYDGMSPASLFRPLRTEREKAIDEMVYQFINHYGDPKGGERYLPIAAKLYDAGYRKEQAK